MILNCLDMAYTYVKATWLFSGLQFQADMGALLVFMFTGNMLGAIFLLPAIARFLPLDGRSKTIASAKSA